MQNVYAVNNSTWKTACIVLDSGVDTFMCSNCELGPVWLRDSLNRQPPRWVNFTNTFIEAGAGGTGLRIDAGRDVRYQGYIASSRIGAALGPAATSIGISNTQFVEITRSAITIAAGATGVLINDNDFDNSGTEADNAYDAIHIAKAAGNFQIHNNTFRTSARNRPRFDVALEGDNADYLITGNHFQGFAKAGLDDRGTAPSKVVERNY